MVNSYQSNLTFFKMPCLWIYFVFKLPNQVKWFYYLSSFILQCAIKGKAIHNELTLIRTWPILLLFHTMPINIITLYVDTNALIKTTLFPHRWLFLNSRFAYYDDAVDYDWLHKGNGFKIHDFKNWKNVLDKKKNIILICKRVEVSLWYNEPVQV